MADLGPVDWPPSSIRTKRLVLREPEAHDRPAFLELLTSPDVNVHLGGPRDRDDVERAMPGVPRSRPGLFVVAFEGDMIGTVTLDRRDATRPGHMFPEAEEVELGYVFLPRAWGFGYAAEACVAALDWVAGAVPGEPVVLCTQTANTRSLRLAQRLGFIEAGRFEEFGAEQWFSVLESASGRNAAGRASR